MSANTISGCYRQTNTLGIGMYWSVSYGKHRPPIRIGKKLFVEIGKLWYVLVLLGLGLIPSPNRRGEMSYKRKSLGCDPCEGFSALVYADPSRL